MDSSKIIREILQRLRHGAGMQDVLAYACEALTKGLNASRCISWIVVGDGLEAKQEFSTDGSALFKGTALDSQESMFIVLEFLSRFADESDPGVINIPDVSQDPSMHEQSPTLTPLLELADVHSQLFGQLRSRGIFSGFIEVQKCGKTADWGARECDEFGEVTTALSVVVQLIFDVIKLRMDLDDLRLRNDIAAIFGDAKDCKIAWKSAASLLASHMGFEHAQIYIRGKLDESDLLIAQIDHETAEKLKLTDRANPFVETYLSGRGKVLNGEYPRGSKAESSDDLFFTSETALLLPLKIEDEQIGVLGLWQRQPDAPHLIPQDRELGLTFAQLFAGFAKRTAA